MTLNYRDIYNVNYFNNLNNLIQFRTVLIEYNLLLLVIGTIAIVIYRIISIKKKKLINIIFSNENKENNKNNEKLNNKPKIKIPKLPELNDFEKNKKKDLIPDNRPRLWGIKVGSRPTLPPVPGKKLEPPREINVHIPGLILYNSIRNGLGSIRNYFFPDDDKKSFKERLKSLMLNNIELVLLVTIVGTLYIYYYYIVGEHYPIIRGDPNWRPKILKDWRIKLLESYHRPKWNVFQTQLTRSDWYYGPDRPPIVVIDRKFWWAVIIDYNGFFPDYAKELKRRVIYNFTKQNRNFYNHNHFSLFGDIAADRKKRTLNDEGKREGKRESTVLFKEFLERRDQGEPVRIEAWKKAKTMFHEYKQMVRRRRKKPE